MSGKRDLSRYPLLNELDEQAYRETYKPYTIQVERNLVIYERVTAGEKLIDIALDYGISSQRVDIIMNRMAKRIQKRRNE